MQLNRVVALATPLFAAAAVVARLAEVGGPPGRFPAGARDRQRRAAHPDRRRGRRERGVLRRVWRIRRDRRARRARRPGRVRRGDAGGGTGARAGGRLSMASPRLIERLRAEGVLRPQAVVEEAKRAGLRLPPARALLEKESGGGRNVFGHDPTIFVGAGEVTRAKYAEYKRRRVASGNRMMQGVGPCQLTWWEFQDTADREGGCWRPDINMRVGFRHLVALMNQHGEADGARRYNGSGPAAEAYSRDLLAKARVWEARLAGHAVPAAPAGPHPGRRGDSGELVEQITKRLSVVHSRRTGRPYLDGARRRFDGEAEAALKEFQRDHRLDADGVFGARSARALNRAVELERERRKREEAKPAPARREPARPRVARREPARPGGARPEPARPPPPPPQPAARPAAGPPP